MKRSLILLAGAVALPLLAAESNPDEAFFKALADGGLSEVTVGKIAQTKTSRHEVKHFAAMMVEDHGAANEKLKSLAERKGIKLPDALGLKHKAQAELLQEQAGSDFDRAYIDGQIKDHRDTEELLQKEIASGKDDDAKAFAREILPKVQAHLKEIENIKAGV
jgi:putative membrane protein